MNLQRVSDLFERLDSGQSETVFSSDTCTLRQLGDHRVLSVVYGTRVPDTCPSMSGWRAVYVDQTAERIDVLYEYQS